MLVRGLVLPEESGPPKISVQDIVPLEVARVNLPSLISITVPLNGSGEGKRAAALHELFARKPGETEVRLRLEKSRDFSVILDVSAKVRPDKEFRAEVARICGAEAMESSGRVGLTPAALIMADSQPSIPTNPSWERVLLARHAKRPHTLDYIQRLITDFEELHGDRGFADDHAIVAGMGWFEERPVMVIGQQKGRDTKQRLFRNFGMPKPEGYRKAMRLMELAAKFSRPIVTLLDTAGAYHGVDAEERGQGEAIAHNLREMSRLGVPVIVVVIGEGGSGGALALGVGNRIYMLENAVYSVISPESCASIIYRDSSRAPAAAAALKMTAPDLLGLGLIDGIVPEPGEGAQSDPDGAAESLRLTLRSALAELGSPDAAAAD